MFRRWAVGVTLISVGLMLITYVPFSSAQTNPEPLFTIHAPSSVSEVLWNPDGQSILAYTRGGGAWIWDSATGEQTREFSLDSAFDFQWNKSGTLLLTPSIDEAIVSISIWHGDQEVFKYSNAYEYEWSPTGDFILVTGYTPGGQTAQVWDVRDQAGMVQEWVGFEHGVATERYAIAYDGANLAVYDYQESEVVFDRRYDGIVRWAGWDSIDNTFIARLGNSLVVIDLTGELLRAVEIDPYVEQLYPSPDGSMVAVWSRLNNTLSIIDSASLDTLWSIQSPEAHLQWKPDNTALLAIDAADSKLKIWDAVTHEIRTLETGDLPIDSGQWANQTEAVLLTSNTSVMYYDLTTDQNFLLDSNSRQPVLSPDDQRLLLWSEDTTEVWNTADFLAIAQNAPDTIDQLAVGKQYFESMACAGCHPDTDQSVGGSLQGIYGQERVREDGTTFVVDEEYLRGSIVDPRTYLSSAGAGLHPSHYAKVMTDYQIDALVAYMVSLSEP